MLNLLLLPLVGGFLFASLCNRTKYYLDRQDGYRLLFYSAGFAALFAALAHLLVLYGECVFPNAVRSIQQTLSLGQPHLGTAYLALIIGASLWWPVNKTCFNEFEEIVRSIRRHADKMELLLLKSVIKDKPVMLTMANDKVYIGWIMEIPIPSGDEYTQILPYMSGYRHKDSRELVLSMLYPEYTNEPGADLGIVLPIADIRSATFYDLEDKFLGQQTTISDSLSAKLRPGGNSA